MSILSKCCCDCCLTAEDMPFTSVQLIAPTDDCVGGIGEGLGGGVGVGVGVGDPLYPSASFVSGGCCFIADFNLACQEYTKVCGLWASQDISYSYGVDLYKSKVSYRQNTSTPHECPCVKVQSIDYSITKTDKIYWVGRYKLIGVRIHVGKANVTCSNGSVGCRFYVAATYIFETCDYALMWGGGVSFYPEFTQRTICTGVYKNGTCSFSSDVTENSSINNCTDVLNSDPFAEGLCPPTRQQYISRIKLFDTLPTGQVSITNADLPPVSCCGSQTGCTISGTSCGLYLVSNCVPNLPAYDGPPMAYFCQRYDILGDPPYPEGCEIVIGCPSVLEKESRPGLCQGYTFEAFQQGTGCFQRDLFDQSAVYPGFDRIVCGYCIDENGIKTYYDAIGLGNVCGTDLCLADGCCLTQDQPPQVTTCNEFNSEQYCRIDVRDFECSIGDLQTYETGAFCYHLPTVTIQLV